jgi:hypothetical protein
VKGYKRKLEEVTFQEQATKRKPQRSKKVKEGAKKPIRSLVLLKKTLKT